jgi:hypothetical protein
MSSNPLQYQRKGMANRSFVNSEVIQSFIMLASIMFLPASVCYLFAGTSHSPGTILACTIILIILARSHFPSDSFIPLMIVTSLITIHLFLATEVTSSQLDKALLSVFLFSFLFISTFTLADWLFHCTGTTINRITSMLRLLMVLAALASMIGVEPRGVNPWDKPIFPFTEPSHYALVFTPLLLDACVKSRGWKKYGWILIGYLLAYGLKSLSLSVGTTLAALVTLPLLQLLLGALITPLVLLSVNLTYFTERLDFGGKTTNLSTLVYLQGQDLIVDSMRRSLGWGIGFQQLGNGPIRSTASTLIYQTTGLELNLQDGGFVAAKLISEFGVFGILLTVGFVMIAIRSALILRNVSIKNIVSVPGRDFALAIIVSYFVDMFVRGIAYFTASSALFLAALIFYLRNRRTMLLEKTS